MRGFRQVQASQTQQYHTFASSKIQNVRLPSSSSIFNETLSHFCFVEDSRGLDSRGVGRPGADLLTQVLDLAGVLGTASAWLLAGLVPRWGSRNMFTGAKSMPADAPGIKTPIYSIVTQYDGPFYSIAPTENNQDIQHIRCCFFRCHRFAFPGESRDQSCGPNGRCARRPRDLCETPARPSGKPGKPTPPPSGQAR